MSIYLTQSISESFHASVIAQHLDQRRFDRRDHLRPAGQGLNLNPKESEKSSTKDEISVRRQCLLVMVFAGIELSGSFTTIYNVLFLQFLGVPTSLVSIGGVICGVATLVLLPIVGWFSDKGSNPVKNKMIMIIIGYIIYALGYIGLAFSSAWKLHPSDGFQTNSSSEHGHKNISILKQSSDATTLQTGLTSHSNPSYSKNVSTSSISDLGLINRVDNTTHEDVHGNEVTFISFIGIISFALLDIAFTCCMSLCRAFVLECSPFALHSRLLIMSTAFGASASCLAGLVGTLDLPGTLGPLFHVDGMPATILVFSCGILCIITLSFICTLIVGYLLTKEKYKDVKEIRNRHDSYMTSFKRSLRKHSYSKASTESLFHRTNPSEPLLLSAQKHIKNHYYTSEPRSLERQNSFDIVNIPTQRLTEDQSNILHENKILDITFQRETNDKNNEDCDDDVDDDDDHDDDHDDDKSDVNDDESSFISSSGSEVERENESVFDENEEEEDQPKNTGISSVLATIVNSYSVSMSVTHSNLISLAHQGAWKRNKKILDISSKPQPIWKNKRLMILCVSVFFSMGGLFSFGQFGGNTLTIGIYHGNPLAVPGSHGRQMYEKGVRQAALGFLICFILYSTTSVLMKKIIDLIGEFAQFILCQVALLMVLVALVLFKIDTVYFVATAIVGFYRACPYTLGYILANKFVQDDSVADGTRPVQNLGRVMVLIGMMMPCSYLLISSFMGPLMSVTNNTFVPIIYGAINAGLSLFVFCLLFLVKK